MAFARLPYAFNWKYALGEFTLIVTGVLVALAANSWWESRQRAEREHTYLLQLLADTRENQRRVDATFREDSIAHASARRVSRLLESTGPLPPPDSAARLMRSGVFQIPEFRPLLGTYRALLEAGDLQLLGAASLRFRLVAYLSSIETAQEILHQTSERIAQEEDQFFEELVPLSRGGPREGPDLVRLARGSPTVSLAVGAALWARGRRLGMLESLREEGAQLIQSLEAEIGAEALQTAATDSVRFPQRRRNRGPGPPPPARQDAAPD